MKKILSTLVLTLIILSFGCPFNDTEKYIKDLKSENITVRNTAIYYVGKNKEKRAVPVLIELLRNAQEKETKLNAIEALGKIGDSGSVDLLIAFLGEKENEIRIATIEALGKIKDPRAVKPLINLLKDKDVQFVAIWALGNIGDKSAIPALTKLLNDPDKYVRYNASQSLKKIGSRL